MKNHELVKHIETHYKVEDVKYKGLQLWLEIRNRFYSKLFEGKESTLKIDNSTYLFVIKTALYGFFNWFRSYEAWFLGSSINRVEVEGKYYDRHFDHIATKFKKSLFIELSTGNLIPRKKLFSKYVVSKSPLILFEKFIALFTRVNANDFKVLNQLKADYKVDIDFNYSVKKMITQYRVMKFVLFFNKPKVVFIAPSYTAYGYIKAFKEKGIKVVEVQHGVILKEHFGYNVYAPFGRDYFVDYLLTLGAKEKHVFEHDNLGIDPKNVIPVGSYYLDYIHNHPLKIELPKSNDKKTSFAVSLQELPIGDQLIDFIVESALACPNFVFYLKTRRRKPLYYIEKYEMPDNVVFIEDLNVYQLIQQCDYHMSIYSTCAIEAPVLGVQNVLVNIDGKAKAIFGNDLKSGDSTIYVDDVKEFIDVFKAKERLNAQDVIAAHSEIISSNYQLNVEQFLRQLYA